jgi:hypothetical protein
MWERWFVEFNKHPVCDPDLTTKALALMAFYYCDHAGHRTLTANEYAAAIEAIVPNSSVAFNVLLNLGEWERWVATWAGMHIKFELTHHRSINRLMGLLEHQYKEPISPRQLAGVIIGGCKIYDDLLAPEVILDIATDMSLDTIRKVVVDHPHADVTWEESRTNYGV